MTVYEKLCNSLEQLLSGQDAEPLLFVEEVSRHLATDKIYRQTIGGSSPSIWPAFHSVWERIVNSEDFYNPGFDKCILCMARFTRNLVADVEANQLNAFASEPHMRTLIYRRTSFAATEAPGSYLTTRMLLQALSNMVTSNDYLINQLWEVYLNLPEEQNVLMRAMSHSDDIIVASVLVLILNCIYQSKHRTSVLVTTLIGGRLCILMLDTMAKTLDFDESHTQFKIFETTYKIFSCIFDQQLSAPLLDKLKIEGEVVTPHQTNFLKAIDSYLLELSPGTAAARYDILQCIIPLFFHFCDFFRAAIRRFLNEATPLQDASSSHEAKEAPSHLLPRVSEAMVLVTQCLCTVTLADESIAQVDSAKSAKSFVINSTSSTSPNFIEILIDVTRLLDQFIPRVALGKVIPHTGQIEPSDVDPSGFNYLKRDLVRLLGILSFRNKTVQDRIRLSDGIPVVMNLCVIDERNPYIREHALFTLRNILEGNEENQAAVDEIRPVPQWDDSGILNNIPRAEYKS